MTARFRFCLPFAPLLILNLVISTLLAGPAALAQAPTQAKTQPAAAYETLTFPSADGLQITADLYRPYADPSTPLIVLCHQARWSRGEYREIAPRLGKLGFNCLAIDQRSGDTTQGVPNETHAKAKTANKPTSFLDAEQDMVAALEFAHTHYANGPVVLWGSSYSSSLALRIAGEHPDLVNGVLAFAPGEYFARLGKPNDWIKQSARKITSPAFITSAKKEAKGWLPIFNAIPGDAKTRFIPKSKGQHGSRALWKQFDDSEAYWEAVSQFLGRYQ